MSCAVCSSPCVDALCSSCSALTIKVDAQSHIHQSFKGSGKSQMRDRQWQFKHAREQLANGKASNADLQSVSDRLPHSRAGEKLREKIADRLAMPAFNPFPQ